MAKLISADISNNKLCILEYTTTDGQMLSVKEDAFDAKIISHTYTNVGSIIFEKPITKIGNHGFDSYFEECNNLKSITIPDSVTTIGDYAFAWCGSLTSVTIPDSVTTIGEDAFCGCSIKEFKGKFAADGGRCLIIDGVLNAFAIGCGVTQYTIPDSVTTIGWWAFFWCKSLTSVTIPDSVTTIGMGAFYDCSSLKNVTIGSSVREIGVEAFNSFNIDTIVCCPQVPPKLNNSFGKFENLIVPTGCEEAYANSDWGQYLE